MTGSRIYSDFAPEISWVRECVKSDLSALPSRERAAAEYYVTIRLKILSYSASQNRIDPKLGRPVPYAAFWFADAFGHRDSEFSRLVGLLLVYNSIVTTLKDDLLDSAPRNRSSLNALACYWSEKYAQIAKSTFPSRSGFWKAAHFAKGEWGRYDRWNSSFDETAGFEPYSASFLRESSRYFFAVVYPVLAGIASIARKEQMIPQIGKFLRQFSMGWRIFDDLMDWDVDLNAFHYNRSSVLYYLRNTQPPGERLNRDLVLSSFLSETFLSETYGTMLRFLRGAQQVASGFRNYYLSTFMREQVEFHSKRRDAGLRLESQFFSQLESVLSRTGNKGI